MNGPGLFDLPTEETNTIGFLDLPQEIRDIIFKEVKIDDMKKNMPIEMEYDILQKQTALKMITAERLYREAGEVFFNHMASPDYMTTDVPPEGSRVLRILRATIWKDAKKKFDKVSKDRMIFENIVYRNVARKARILKVENINRYFS